MATGSYWLSCPSKSTALLFNLELSTMCLYIHSYIFGYKRRCGDGWTNGWTLTLTSIHLFLLILIWWFLPSVHPSVRPSYTVLSKGGSWVQQSQKICPGLSQQKLTPALFIEPQSTNTPAMRYGAFSASWIFPGAFACLLSHINQLFLL